MAGCSRPLPDPDAAGAVVLRQRCAGCHAIPTPGSMTYDMWMMQIERMRGVFAQRGLPWLTPEERSALEAYLRTHAGTV